MPGSKATNKLISMGESRFIGVALATALCGVPAIARAAGDPLELAPSSAWVMDYAEDSCALRRAFEAGDHQALLQLRAYGPAPGLQVTISSGTLKAERERASARFQPDPEFRSLDSFRFDGAEADGIVYSDSLLVNKLKTGSASARRELENVTVADRDAREREITALEVRDGFERPLRLQIGAMHQPMNAMRACLDELLSHWGLDAAVQRTLSRPAMPLDQSSWVRRISQRYPTEMLRQGRSGLSNVRLIVGIDGVPTACIPNKDAIDRSFDEFSCETLMRYAKFEPALDANGQPTPSFWTTTVSYLITN